MKKKALVLALIFAGVLVSVSIEAGVRPTNGMRLGNGVRLSNGLSVSPTGLDFTTISHHRLGK